MTDVFVVIRIKNANEPFDFRRSEIIITQFGTHHTELVYRRSSRRQNGSENERQNTVDRNSLYIYNKLS